MISRRTAILLGSAALVARPSSAPAQVMPNVSVTKDPNCGCCSGWVSYLRRNGFPVSVTNVEDLSPLKAKLKIPDDLTACHTAQIAGYILEGHVPLPAIQRMLKERPGALGLAVAGMPTGSPGMPGSGHEEYSVTLFDKNGLRADYGRYKGDKLLS